MRELIAVIDDNTLSRLLVSDAVREIGYEPVPYTSASEALAAMELRLPKACVVDQTMPGMTGAEFIRTLKGSSNHRLRSIPVVGLTGGLDRELLAAGASSCLKKPFSELSLARALDTALAGEARHHEGAPTSPARALAEFGAAHAQAAGGQLGPAEMATYRSMRRRLSRAMLAIQEAGRGAYVRPRRSVRVLTSVEVELRHATETSRARTIDISAEGFAARLDHVLPVGEVVEFVIASRERLVGRARVANVVGEDPQRYRVGFAFEGLTTEQRDSVEALVVDLVLSQLQIVG